MGFENDFKKEYEALLKKRNNVVRTGAISLQGDLQTNTPVAKNVPSRPWKRNPNKKTKSIQGGELRDSWQPPEKLGTLSWRIANIAPYAYIIDGGRRQVSINGTTKWIGSEQLPNGFNPIINVFEKKLQKELDKIK